MRNRRIACGRRLLRLREERQAQDQRARWNGVLNEHGSKNLRLPRREGRPLGRQPAQSARAPSGLDVREAALGQMLRGGRSWASERKLGAAASCAG